MVLSLPSSDSFTSTTSPERAATSPATAVGARLGLVAHPEPGPERRRHRPARHLAGRPHGHPLARDPPPRDAEGDEPVEPAGLALRPQRRGAHELLAIERAHPAQTRLERRAALRQVVAVERIADLEPQRVARAEAGRCRAGSEELVPERPGLMGGDHDLDTG